jgi:hypothetical protein
MLTTDLHSPQVLSPTHLANRCSGFVFDEIGFWNRCIRLFGMLDNNAQAESMLTTEFHSPQVLRPTQPAKWFQVFVGMGSDFGTVFDLSPDVALWHEIGFVGSECAFNILAAVRKWVQKVKSIEIWQFREHWRPAFASVSTSVRDPWHFGTYPDADPDPDPRIRTSD